MQEDALICPWCQTEIVWDEEIGPEKYCPHCDNELSGYRTLQIGIEQEEDEDKEANVKKAAHVSNFDTSDGEEQDDELEDIDWIDDTEGVRHGGSSWFAVEETLEKLFETQDEVPECPVCREYMVEVGKQVIKEKRFEPRMIEGLNKPVLSAPFELLLYVCPACFYTQYTLGSDDREKLMKVLTADED